MTLTFASSEWLWCLLLLPPLALLRLWSQYRGGAGAPGLVSPRLKGDLIIGATQWKRWVIFSIQLTALALLLLALARPQWGFEDAEIESEGRNVIIAIDTSRSMLARDLLPDRITRAKLAAQDIVEELPADRIGLIAFAGKAFLQAPLTVDHSAVVETIRQFDTELIPRGGTNLSSAVKLAVTTLLKADSRESALILLSDGENLEGEEDLEVLRSMAESVGLVLVAIGVGTEPGELIPELDDKGRIRAGEFVKDDGDKVVRTRLDPVALQELSSQIGGGVYLNLGATADVPAVVKEAIEQIEAVRRSGDSSRRPIERFLWPLGASIFLLLVAWLLPGALRVLTAVFGKRPAVKPPELSAPKGSPPLSAKEPAAVSAAVLLIAVSLGVPQNAAAQGALESARESAGFAALQRNAYDSAITAYEEELAGEDLGAEEAAWLNLGLGSAAYRTGDFEKAKAAFGRALEFPAGNQFETKAHYNLGNALYRSGEKLLDGPQNPDFPQLDNDAEREMIAKQWRSALEHYEAALRADSGNRSSRHNLEVVKKRLEWLMKKPPEQEQPEDQPQNNQQNDRGNDNQDQQSDRKPEPQDDPPDPDQENQEETQEENPADPDNQGENEQPENPNQNQEPPDQSEEPGKPPEKPPEGELEAQPDSRPPERSLPPNEVNPETGFSAEQARQQLRTLSDEDLEVRPAQRLPIKAERFKNW